MRWDVIDEDTKTKSSRRRLLLTAMMEQILMEIRAQQSHYRQLFGRDYCESGYICTKPDGTPVDPDFVTHHFIRMMQKSNLPPLRFHDLRHSAVYMLRQGGCDAKDIQVWLGHSDVSTTLNIYGHLLEEDLGTIGGIVDRTFRSSLA